LSENSLVEIPSIDIDPKEYLSNPPIMFNKVLFPHPDGPKIDTNSLSLNSIEISLSASIL
jgi:hypothetical protein